VISHCSRIDNLQRDLNRNREEENKMINQISMMTLLLTSAVLFPSSPRIVNARSTLERPNIIFILADDQGWNGTSVQMHPDMLNSKSDYYRTPNIERLARAGLRFSNAYSPGPMCSPTRASLQTGKSPAQLRMTNVGGTRPATPSQRLVLPPHSSTLSTEEITIGETLKRAGYATAWFGKWHLGGDQGPAAHGYDEHDGPTGNADGNSKDPDNPKDIFGITNRGIAFIEKNAKSGKPFYLQLWHYAVHGAVQTRAATEATYAARPAGKTHQSAAFAAMTEDLDTSVGMILDKIDELAIADNTYIIYMSDHGAGLRLSSNSPLRQGKGTLWEGGLRVPLIIRGPGVKPGAFCDVPTVGWDLFPTFCALAGVQDDMPPGIEGGSLRPLFATGTGNVKRDRDGIAFHYPHYGQGGGGSNNSPHSVIVIDNYKLMKFYETNELYLFNLKEDIGEQRDLSSELTEKTAMMHQRLKDYLKSVNAGLPTPNQAFDPNAIARSGRRGRRGALSQRIADRKKELIAFEEALEQGDSKKMGDLIAGMKQRFESGPTRARRQQPGRAGGTSAREQRRVDLQQLEEAHRKKDVEKLRQLIAEIKKRLENTPTRSRPGP
jgi:arylsulfatase A-like enzyme